MYKMVSAITVERSRRSRTCCFLFVNDDDEGEEDLPVIFSPAGFCGNRWDNTCLVTKSQARVKSRGKQR